MRMLRQCLIAIVFIFSAAIPNAFADYRVNLHKGVTPLSHDIYFLHMTIFWICVAIGIIVFGVLTYSLIYHRKSRGHKAAQFHEHTVVEIIWAVIPFLILVAMAIPATIVLFRMYDDTDSQVTIKVTGYQWKWKYDYLNEGISFFSNISTPLAQINNQAPKDQWYLLEVDKPLVVPIHQKIRFLITSNDVVHSWFVPQLGIKRDAMPGFITEAWARINKAGTYRGQCAELCGVNHGYMPIVVIAKTESDYQTWVKQQRGEITTPTTPAGAATGTTAATKSAAPAAPKIYTLPETMKTGEAKYNTYCAVCHKPDGTGIPPTILPLKGSSVTTGKPISRHLHIILHGVPGTAMQAFGEQLNDEDLAAIATYERNAWGNTTGDLILPEDVKKERETS